MYKVSLRKSAIKQLSKIPINEAIRISKELNKLSIDPRPKGALKPKGYKNLYRIRISNYRAIYGIYDEILIVEVVKIADRKDIY
jgi:mRNA interferase RelE/StbE